MNSDKTADTAETLTDAGSGAAHGTATESAVPRKAARKGRRPWVRQGTKLGFWRGPVAWVDRTIHGARYRVSTGARSSEAAWAEYQKFEANPAHYKPLTERVEGTGWQEVCKAFLLSLRDIEGKSERYVLDTADMLDRWGAYPNFTSLDSFTQQDIEAFLSDLKQGKLTYQTVSARDETGKVIWERAEDGSVKLNEKGHRVSVKVQKPIAGKEREATRNRHLAALKSLMSWAREREKPLTKNAADTTVRLGQENKNSRPPKVVEKGRWEAAGSKLIEKWLRAQEVLLGSGLRYGELARLKPEDIEPRGIVVRIAKRRKGRTVPVSERTVKAARRLLELGGVPDDSAVQMDDRLEAACRAAGVKRYTAHQLRHTFATTCLRNKVDIRTLQTWLGHASLATTMKYLHAVQAQDGLPDVPAPL